MDLELEQLDFMTAPWSAIDAVVVGHDAKQSCRDFYLGRLVLAVYRRALWAEHFASFANYFEIRLGWDPHTTSERRRTAEALEELPLISRELREGRLRWTAARELTRIAMPHTEADWIYWSKGKTTHAIAYAVKVRPPGAKPNDEPRPELFTQKMSFDCDAEQYAFIRRAIAHVREILHVTAEQMSDTECLVYALKENLLEKMRVDLTRCPTCRAAGIRVNGDVVDVPPEVAEEAMCTAQVVEKDGTLRSRHIPEPIDRAVAIRANYRCEVPTCRFHRYCRTHHLKLFSAGGKHSLVNLMYLCALCRARHKRHYADPGFMPRSPAAPEESAISYAA